ncbi:MAG: hypothetical protein LBP59_18820 [Planctomycetaceae bacterium]|nr:hypothetical protein [Planctomycetaceae bacterium]
MLKKNRLKDRRRLVCISGSQAFQDRGHFVWGSFKFAGETVVFLLYFLLQKLSHLSFKNCQSVI